MIKEIQEVEVTIPATFSLKGTLTIPEKQKGDYPAILILPGTGKNDRDGNSKKLKLNLYKDLADYLGSLGFVTLRFDKRGVGESEGNYYETGLWDLVDDAVSCLQFLHEHEMVDPNRIIILGHSEGAIIAPAVYSKYPVQGLILLAGASAPMKDILPLQSEMAIKELSSSKGLKGLLIRLLKVPQKLSRQNEAVFQKMLASTDASMRIKGVKMNAKWFREHFEYNPREYLQHVTCPTLAITGSNDIQVVPDHARDIAEQIEGDGEWRIITDMNHILRKYPHEHSILKLIQEYKQVLLQPLDPDLLFYLDQWLNQHFSHS